MISFFPKLGYTKSLSQPLTRVKQEGTMAHQDKGHYANKHQGKIIDETISKKINSLAENSNLACASAHRIARDLGILPLEIGVQTDLMEYRICQCQMGLFGHFPETKKLNPDIEVSKDLGDALDEANTDNKISCAECWEIAATLKIKKMDVGSACEKMDIRIKPCQLGAF